MTQSTITYTSDAHGIGTLSVPGDCTLEELYAHPDCPHIIKQSLEKHVSWQMRCETPLYRGLRLKNQYLQFRAAMALYGVEPIEEEETLALTIGESLTGFSMVRPTPTHTPIVSSFVRVLLEDKTVKECTIALTGIEKRQITLADANALIGKPLSDGMIKTFADEVSNRYEGFSDFNGDAEYRKAMIAVTLERALQEVKHE